MLKKALPLLGIILLASVLVVSPSYAVLDLSDTQDIDRGIDFGTATTSDDYAPIKWGLIVLGGYDYYAMHSFNPIQRVEAYLQARGVPYDLFQDDAIEAPGNSPSLGKYPLQYGNGTLRYQVLVLILNSRYDSSAVNANYIYSAVGNGTNTVVFGMAAKVVPKLLGISASKVSLVQFGSGGVTCNVLQTFDDGVKKYTSGSNVNIAPFVVHTKLQNSTGKTVWYKMTRSTNWWIGMMNGTYGNGQVWYNSLVPDSDSFLGPQDSSYEDYWVNHHFDFIGHALNFMFNQVEKVNVGIQGYKQWKGALVIRLDEDTIYGLEQPINEEALKAGWVYDYLICSLGYHDQVWYSVSSGMPANYVGSPSSKVKNGNANYLLFGGLYRSYRFIIYNSTVGGKYDRIRLDFNQNKNFLDDAAYRIFENITYAGMDGKYYWTYLDNQANPTLIQFSKWQPLRSMTPPEWLATYKYYGATYGVSFGFHGWQHSDIGNASYFHSSYMWDGARFVANQTYVEEMFNRSRDELAYVFGSSGNGFEADEVTLAQPGNRYAPVSRQATGNLSYFLSEYGGYSDTGLEFESEPGFYIPQYGKPILASAFDGDTYAQKWALDGLIDMARTVYPVIAVYGHGTGSYNLAYKFTPYSNMLKPANPRDAFNFWSDAKFMLRNTANAYYKNGKMTIEFKANSTLKDYVWKFPIEYEGRFFNGFSDNRSTGKIKHFDGKYVYVEFSQGQGGQKLEAAYDTSPHLYKTSNYIENITQAYAQGKLTLKLWNSSGSIKVNVDTADEGQPNSVSINGNPASFSYNSTTRMCSFDVTFGSLRTVEILWTVPESAVIRGTVTDSKTGSSIDGVIVTCDGVPMTTGSDGSYSFTVNLGTHTLTYSRTGYVNQTMYQECPTQGEYILNVLLQPVPKAVIAGTVIDSQTQNPIEGVTVTCDGKSTVTSQNGYYSFTLSLGSYSLTFKKTGYIIESRTQDCPAEGEYIVDVPLQPIPTATIKGIVTEIDTGNPIQGVSVTTDGNSTLTAPDGSYSMKVNLGLHILVFSRTGYADETRVQDCPTAGEYVINVFLSPLTATIRGTVTDSKTATPIAGVNVTVDGAMFTLTDSDGSYSFTVSLGQHTLTFKKIGYTTETRTQNCPSQGEYILNMTMALVTATIRGTVTDAESGTPVSGVNVTCDGASSLTPADGSYSFIVNLGLHTMVFKKFEYVTQTRDQDCPSEGVYTVNVALMPRVATITGIVTDSASGKPLDAVKVSTSGYQTSTNSSGNYRLTVRLGSYTLTFEKSGYYTKTATVNCPTEGTYMVSVVLALIPPPSAIFSSGFETGDYSEWTGIATEGGATIALVSDVKHHGSFSSKAVFTRAWQGAWAEEFDLSANPVYVRWYSRFDKLPGNSQAFTLMESLDSGWNTIWELDIERSAAGKLRIFFYRMRPGEGFHYYEYAFQASTWYCFEVKYYLHASAGEYRVYLNGVEVITLTGLNTGGSAWRGIRAGRGSGYLSSLTTWTDCVQISNSYIGPETSEAMIVELPQITYANGTSNWNILAEAPSERRKSVALVISTSVGTVS